MVASLDSVKAPGGAAIRVLQGFRDLMHARRRSRPTLNLVTWAQDPRGERKPNSAGISRDLTQTRRWFRTETWVGSPTGDDTDGYWRPWENSRVVSSGRVGVAVALGSQVAFHGVARDRR